MSADESKEIQRMAEYVARGKVRKYLQTDASRDKAQEIVRCSDCIFWNECDSTGFVELGNFVCSCARWTVEDGVTFYTKPNDFCSYGERRDDNA